jgi:signal transduction histidine kinase
MKKRDLYRLALLGAVIVVLINTWVAARSLRKVLTSQDWVTHTQRVIVATEQLVAEIRTSESAARGYILVGTPDFENQYQTAGKLASQTLSDIQQLTSDNPNQQRQLADLRRRIAAKMTVLDDGIAVRRGHPDSAIDPSLVQPVVDDTPDRIASVQTAIRDIQAEEQRLLAQRTANVFAARRQVWVTFIVAFMLDLVLLILAFEILVRLSQERELLADNAEHISYLNTQLASLNTQLQAANSELEERVAKRTRELAFSNQELEAFSYSVSHDLRAPLRTIDGFSLALQEDFADKLDDSGRDYITRVRSGVQRMGTLIDALLQLSRVTRSELQSDSVDLSQLATLVFNELQASEPTRRVAFTAQPGVIVQGDTRLLRIALENLLGNAWKFTSKTPDARIEFGTRPGTQASAVGSEPPAVGLEPPANATVYFIKDNGAGFDMQYVDRLFTAFQRLHGDRDFKGSGIGLATVSRIVRRHHGTIGAVSEPGHGATFHFTLAAGSTSVAPLPTHDKE